MKAKNRERLHEKYGNLKLKETSSMFEKVEYLADYILVIIANKDKFEEICYRIHKFDKMVFSDEHVMVKFGPVEFSERKLEQIYSDVKDLTFDYWVEEYKYVPGGKRELKRIFMFDNLFKRKYFILSKRLDILKGELMSRQANGYIVLTTDPAGKQVHKILETLPEKPDGKVYKIKKQKDIVIKLKRGDASENDNVLENIETENPLCFIDGHLGKFKEIKDNLKIGSTLYILEEPDEPSEGGLFVTKSDKKFLVCYNKGVQIVVDNLNDVLAGEISKIYKLKGMVTDSKKGRMRELDDNDEIVMIGNHGVNQKFPCKLSAVKSSINTSKLDTVNIYIIEEEVKFGIGLK